MKTMAMEIAVEAARTITVYLFRAQGLRQIAKRSANEDERRLAISIAEAYERLATRMLAEEGVEASSS